MVKNNSNLNETRIMNISNFKNLGVNASDKQKNKRAFLKLNRSLEYEGLGGLVLVLGLNNSGKTNVITAVEKFKKNNYDGNDIPDFIIRDGTKLETKIEMNIANGKYADKNGASVFEYLSSRLRSQETFNAYMGLKKKPVTVSDQYQMNNLVNNTITLMNNLISNGTVPAGYEGFAPVIKEMFEKDEEFIKKYEQAGEFIALLNDVNKNADEIAFFLKSCESDGRYEFLKKYGYLLSDGVYRYAQKPIKQGDLVCQPNAFNGFFKDLMSILGESVESLSDVYSRPTPGLREKLQNKCNEKMETISETFNRIFTADPENKYKFKVKFETNHLYFMINRGDISLENIDRQSEGFRWIFDFYFNFIMKESFEPGDIILMDEFGYNLNPKSVQEVRSVLRDYAKENGVTVVIATQNFMVVDRDHLNEVRLVINEPNGNTRIINEFDQFNHSNHDVMRPLLDCLTISRNFMRTEGRTTVFVEGASDYFFLTAFAKIMRAKRPKIDVDFVPINGLGKTDADLKETIKTLLSIDPNPIILVDSDGKAKKFESFSKGDRVD